MEDNSTRFFNAGMFRERHFEFGLNYSGGQALRLQEQVIEIAVAPTTAQQRFDVSIDGFHNPQRHLDLR
jgi:hypothetical protein